MTDPTNYNNLRDLNLASLGVAAFVFAVYYSTIAPSVNFIDSGELSAVAHTFGIAHPTGYPLFTFLAGLWAFLPIGSGVFRLNLLSALICAITSGVVVQLCALIIDQYFDQYFAPCPPPVPKKRKKKRKTTDEVSSIQPNRWLPLLAPIFAGVALGLSETFWHMALSVEVYPLHMLMVSLSLFLFFKALSQGYNQKLFLVFSLTLGLAFSNHMTTIYLVPGLAFFFFVRQGRAGWAKIPGAAGAFALGLTPYLYLPLRASMNPTLNWGNPNSIERFFWHISGNQYREWIFSSTEVASRQFRYFISVFPSEFAWIPLLLAVIGVIISLQRSRALALTLLIFFVSCVVYSINYDIHDIDSYFLLAYLVTALFSAIGLVTLLNNQKWKKMAIVIAALTPIFMIGASSNEVNERGNYLVEDYTKNLFDTFKENALVFSFQWDYWISASYYYQLVEGLRPDVVIIDKELLRRSHYLHQIAANYPDVFSGAELELHAFQKELSKFEHNEPYDDRVIDNLYYAFIDRVIETNYAQRPIYVTLEIEPEVGRNFHRVPEGLAFRLYRNDDFPSASIPVWDDFGYRPFTRRSDRLITGLLSAYPTMLTNRGIFYNQAARFDEAHTYFMRALEFDPGFKAAVEWRSINEESRNVLRPPVLSGN